MPIPVLRYTEPANHGVLTNAASPASLSFSVALNTSALTNQIHVWNTTDQVLVTPVTLTYDSLNFRIGVQGGWVAGNDYTIQVDRSLVDAFGHALGYDLQYAFRVGTGSIYTPELSFPAEGSQIAGPATLTWVAASGATLHRVEVSPYADFSVLSYVGTVGTLATAATYLTVVPLTLTEGQSYYWRARGHNGGWTPSWRFFLGTPTVTPVASRYYITRIEPADQTVHSVLQLVTIHLSATPATPSSTEAYWRMASTVGSTLQGSTWYGEWSIDAANKLIIWTPSLVTLATHVRYDLYLDGLLSAGSMPLEAVNGQVMYSVSGPFDPLFGGTGSLNPSVGGTLTELEEQFYLHLGADEVNTITGTTAYTEEKGQYARLWAEIAVRTMDLGQAVPLIGRDVRLGDYEVKLSYDQLRAQEEYLKILRGRLETLELRLIGDELITGGQRCSKWDPLTLKNDLSWYPQRREYTLEDDAKRRGRRTFPD